MGLQTKWLKPNIETTEPLFCLVPGPHCPPAIHLPSSRRRVFPISGKGREGKGANVGALKIGLATDSATSSTMADPEDLLSESLESLYDHVPVHYSSAGSTFAYTTTLGSLKSTTIALTIPDTQAANWSLHANSIWVSSLYIVDHFEELHLGDRSGPLRILELGAGAGLPSITIARIYNEVQVTCSDYPDPDLIRSLNENVRANDVQTRCRVVPYAWASDASELLGTECQIGLPGFDIVIAADTLWNSDKHRDFVLSLQQTLKRSPESRVYLVAGLHTGRYTIQAFINLLGEHGFVLELVEERGIRDPETRPWTVDRADEDERERRRWVVWMVLRWREP